MPKPDFACCIVLIRMGDEKSCQNIKFDRCKCILPWHIWFYFKKLVKVFYIRPDVSVSEYTVFRRVHKIAKSDY
jgi:hypothetical protein